MVKKILSLSLVLFCACHAGDDTHDGGMDAGRVDSGAIDASEDATPIDRGLDATPDEGGTDGPRVSFSSPQSYPVPTGAIRLIAQDLNGDGVPDAVVGSRDGISVFLGRGDGTMSVAGRLFNGIFVTALWVDDFDGDGKVDLAAANFNAPGGLNVFSGNGDGSFATPPTQYSSFVGITDVKGGDFNGDGRIDLATVDGARVDLYWGDGQGGFTVDRYGLYGGDDPYRLCAGDFTGDGIVDLAVLSVKPLESYTLILIPSFGNGLFNEGALPPVDVNDFPSAIIAGDFNGDGKLDLATNSEKPLAQIWIGNGDGTFESHSVPTSSDGWDLAVADVDGDGALDLMASHYTGSAGGVDVLLGDGHGGFEMPTSIFSASFANTMAVSDFNGDHRPDVAVTNAVDPASGTLNVLLNTHR